MNARRKATFDPSRLDDLDDVLDAPPAPPAPRAEPSPPVAAPAPMASSADVRAARGPRRLPGDALASASTRPGRASQQRAGGEDPRAVKGWSDRSGRTVAVRIPPTLYSDVNHDLLAGRERPSYGQLVVWACEDNREAVVEAIRAARPLAGSRRPRGHRMAAPDVQITLRMTCSTRRRQAGHQDRGRGRRLARGPETPERRLRSILPTR
jgi:hypothetical protein